MTFPGKKAISDDQSLQLSAEGAVGNRGNAPDWLRDYLKRSKESKASSTSAPSKTSKAASKAAAKGSSKKAAKEAVPDDSPGKTFQDVLEEVRTATEVVQAGDDLKKVLGMIQQREQDEAREQAKANEELRNLAATNNLNEGLLVNKVKEQEAKTLLTQEQVRQQFGIEPDPQDFGPAAPYPNPIGPQQAGYPNPIGPQQDFIGPQELIGPSPVSPESTLRAAQAAAQAVPGNPQTQMVLDKLLQNPGEATYADEYAEFKKNLEQHRRRIMERREVYEGILWDLDDHEGELATRFGNSRTGKRQLLDIFTKAHTGLSQSVAEEGKVVEMLMSEPTSADERLRRMKTLRDMQLAENADQRAHAKLINQLKDSDRARKSSQLNDYLKQIREDNRVNTEQAKAGSALEKERRQAEEAAAAMAAQMDDHLVKNTSEDGTLTPGAARLVRGNTMSPTEAMGFVDPLDGKEKSRLPTHNMYEDLTREIAKAPDMAAERLRQMMLTNQESQMMLEDPQQAAAMVENNYREFEQALRDIEAELRQVYGPSSMEDPSNQKTIVAAMGLQHRRNMHDKMLEKARAVRDSLLSKDIPSAIEKEMKRRRDFKLPASNPGHPDNTLRGPKF